MGHPPRWLRDRWIRIQTHRHGRSSSDFSRILCTQGHWLQAGQWHSAVQRVDWCWCRWRARYRGLRGGKPT